MSRSPIATLAKVAATLARPEMERRAYWRTLVRRRHWALILITRSKPDEKVNLAPADLLRVAAECPVCRDQAPPGFQCLTCGTFTPAVAP